MSLDKIISDKSDPDYISAMKICKKRRIGPMRIHSNREIFYKKDIGILARSGFSYDLSKKILSMTKRIRKINKTYLILFFFHLILNNSQFFFS